MGGEPTFVSIDDFESGEWNTDAVGPTKREKADILIRKLRERFAPRRFPALRPGQMVSRRKLAALDLLALLAQGRRPIWSNPDLVAEEGRDYGVGEQDSRQAPDRHRRRTRHRPGHGRAGL
jgi:uncharacterized protein (DUF2126 family)